MPTYTFACPVCGNEEEAVQPISDIRPKCCWMTVDCSGIQMKIVIQKTSFALKGSGWARDGYSGGKR